MSNYIHIMNKAYICPCHHSPAVWQNIVQIMAWVISQCHFSNIIAYICQLHRYAFVWSLSLPDVTPKLGMSRWIFMDTFYVFTRPLKQDGEAVRVFFKTAWRYELYFQHHVPYIQFYVNKWHSSQGPMSRYILPSINTFVPYIHITIYPSNSFRLYSLSQNDLTADMFTRPAISAVFKLKLHTSLWRHHIKTPVNSPYKGQWRGALMFSFVCTWINGKQSWGWWFEAPSCSLWRHCSVQTLSEVFIQMPSHKIDYIQIRCRYGKDKFTVVYPLTSNPCVI